MLRFLPLILCLLYLLAGYRVALSDLGYANRPAAIGSQAGRWFWAAQFHMFNEPRPTVNRVQATISTATGLQSVDLPVLYPTLREEGPSYARSRFLADPHRLELMGQDICRRVGGQSVHLWVERWPKQAGLPVSKEELGSWACR